MRATLAFKTEKKDFERRGNNWVEPLREWVLDTAPSPFRIFAGGIPRHRRRRNAFVLIQ